MCPGSGAHHKKTGIHFDPKSYEESKRLIYHSYIALAYSAIDDFIDKFKSDLKTIYGDHAIDKKRDGETGIEHINRCLKIIKGKHIHDNDLELSYFIIEHYRNIRNEFIHPMIMKKEPISFLYSSKYKNTYLEKYPKFPELANKEKSDIEFADFIVLSKAILDYARYITLLAEPDDDFYEKHIDAKIHSKYSISSTRYVNSIAQYLVTEYNLKPERAKVIAIRYRDKIL